ncbi:MAG: glycosyltransferase family 2 protein [Nitrospinaceae bacterium]
MTPRPCKFTHPPSLDLSIIVVNFNTRDILIECLRSVHEHTPDLSFEIFVVDNHSTDGSVEAVKEHFPEVRLIENTENRGFSAANNQAILLSRGEFIVLLNPDTLLVENSFLKIIRFLRSRPEFSILSPAIIDSRDRLCSMRLWEDTPRDAILKILGKYPSADEFKRMGPLQTREVEVVGGACFVIRRKLFDKAVGLLDENYFLYNEEDDFCRRARSRGQKICFFPDTSVKHLRGKSTHQPEIRERVILETYKSNLYFFSKYYSPGWNVILRFLYCLTFCMGIIRSLFKRVTGRPWRGVEDSVSLKLKLLFMKVPKSGTS